MRGHPCDEIGLRPVRVECVGDPGNILARELFDGPNEKAAQTGRPSGLPGCGPLFALTRFKVASKLGVPTMAFWRVGRVKPLDRSLHGELGEIR
jgi:hypothetical protein